MGLVTLRLPLVRRSKLDRQENLLKAAVLLLNSREQEIKLLTWWNQALQSQLLQTPKEETPSTEPVITMSATPLYMSEDEEDIQWQLDNNVIDQKIATALLKELEFENAEVQLDDEYTYENFHY